jgi:hypothetical protein
MTSTTRRTIIIWLAAILIAMLLMARVANALPAPDTLCLNSGTAGFTLVKALYNNQNGKLYCYYPDGSLGTWTEEEFCTRAMHYYPLVDVVQTIPDLRKCVYQVYVPVEPARCNETYLDSGLITVNMRSTVDSIDTMMCRYTMPAVKHQFCQQANPQLTYLRRVVLASSIKCIYEI